MPDFDPKLLEQLKPLLPEIRRRLTEAQDSVVLLQQRLQDVEAERSAWGTIEFCNQVEAEVGTLTNLLYEQLAALGFRLNDWLQSIYKDCDGQMFQRALRKPA